MSLAGEQADLLEAKAKALRAQADEVKRVRQSLQLVVAEPKTTINSDGLTGPFATRMRERAIEISKRLSVAVDQLRSAEQRLRSSADTAADAAANYRFQERLEIGKQLGR